MHHTRLAVIITMLAFTVCLTSCATIVRGTSQDVSFDSTPQGAEIVLNDKVLGVTPATVSVPKGDNTSIVLRKDGLKDRIITLETEQEWTWTLVGNCLSWGTTGTTTDVATGAHIEYSPNNYHVNLSTGKLSQTDIENIKIMTYVLANYAEIEAELLAGDGDYTRGLHSAMVTRHGQHDFSVFSERIVIIAFTAWSSTSFC